MVQARCGLAVSCMQGLKQHCFVAEKACKAKSPAEVSSKAVTAELVHQLLRQQQRNVVPVRENTHIQLHS